MLTSRTTVTASAIHPYLVNKIAFLHKDFLTDKSKFLQIGHGNDMSTESFGKVFS
jgi:hypothetical protein